ncbi:MAG: HAD family hydrolase [Candidatus Eremiobacteraeota bacterium]|nr:HAD family hydrolase [Candidatus Eremiobacteraeota bacterium]
MRRIDVVFFDLDDTLHDDTLAYQSAAEEVAHEVAAEHGIDALALKAAYIAEAEGFWKRLSAEALQVKLAPVREQLWRSALQSVGVGDPGIARQSALRYHDYRKKYYVLWPGAAECLRGLKERGKKLGLITNGFSETHREKIALLRIGEYFDAVFIADEVGMLKPDPLLFAHACTTLQSSPSHGAMVGDRYDRDIRGARDAGLYTVWLNVREETIPAGAPAPDATVTSIAEAARVLYSLA